MNSICFQINDDIFKVFSNSEYLLKVLEDRKKINEITSPYPIRNIGFIEQFNFKNDDDFINKKDSASFIGTKGNNLYMSINIKSKEDLFKLKRFVYNVVAENKKENFFFVEATAINTNGEGILI